MTRRVATARPAALALERSRQWLCQPGSGAAGRARWQALKSVRRALRDHPYLGSLSAQQPGMRQIVVSGHRLIYTITPDTGDEATAGDILIPQVFGPGQK